MVLPVAQGRCSTARSRLRVVAPDLVGFGRSDKPTAVEEHTYAGTWSGSVRCSSTRRGWTCAGSPSSVRTGAACSGCGCWGSTRSGSLAWWPPTRACPTAASGCRGVVAVPRLRGAHGGLPIGLLMQFGSSTELAWTDVVAAYDAPFPDASFKAGPKAMPDLIPQAADDVAAAPAHAAWQVLRGFEGPFLCAFSDGDPVTRGADVLFTGQVPAPPAAAHHHHRCRPLPPGGPGRGAGPDDRRVAGRARRAPVSG